MIYIVVGLAFFAGFLFVFGVNLYIVDVADKRRQQIREQVELNMRLRQRERVRVEMASKDLSALAAENDADGRISEGMWQRFRRMVAKSGVRLTVGQLVTVSFLVAFVPAVVLLSVLPLLGVLSFSNAMWIAVPVAFLASAIPTTIVAILANRRQEKLLSQLPDAFDLMSRVLRAGQTTAQAMQAVANEFDDPIAVEFSYCYEQQNLGLSPEAALRDLARRTDLLEVRMFVVSMMINREAGGNLSELLDKLSFIIRERYQIRGHIRALTAEGKLQALILIALPFLVLIALMITTPSYALTLFEYPWLLVGMVCANIVGYLWMRSIINFDF